MSFLNKNKGGYIGYFRYSTPEIASGVWNLKQQQQESSSFEWYSQYIYKANGVNGWANGGLSTSPSGVNANESSITVTSVGQYGYVAPLPANDTMLYVTIVCWVYMPVNNAIAIHFAHANNGQGPFLKLDTRPGYFSGLMYGTAWGTYGGEPIQGIDIPSSNWTKIAIRIPSSADASWYIDGTYRDIEVILKNGNNLGIRKFAGSDTCYISDLRIYRGPV
jgi:hypothetical protein